MILRVHHRRSLPDARASRQHSDASVLRVEIAQVTEVGTEVDLVLSFISVVATEAWTVFV